MQARGRDAWDRDADLQAIRDAYDRYDDTGRARLWDQRAPGYRRLAGELQGKLLGALDGVVPMTPASRVVDLGCGDGSLAEQASTIAARTDWIGVDLRSGPIDSARRRFPDLTFIVASADDVPLESASVDVVVARLVFSSFSSAELERRAAAEVARLLRPGGWLVWLDLRYDNPRNAAVHGLSERRITDLFEGWQRDLRPAGLIPPVARRLGWATPVAYPVLASLPLLRSHLVGRLQRPSAGE